MQEGRAFIDTTSPPGSWADALMHSAIEVSDYPSRKNAGHGVSESLCHEGVVNHE